MLYHLSTWIAPLLLAITLHEAAPGYAAYRLGDATAWRLGRVTLNPLRHIDPFGTVLLPAMLLLLRAPFLFGYALPVPVDFRALRHPRRDMVLVAAAGPAMNIVLAMAAATLAHGLDMLPAALAPWFAANLRNALDINVVLAVLNLLPLPPLDGGRIAVGLLPRDLARPLANLEPYGLPILFGVMFILPVVGSAAGIDMDVFRRLVGAPAQMLAEAILTITGNA